MIAVVDGSRGSKLGKVLFSKQDFLIQAISYAKILSHGLSHAELYVPINAGQATKENRCSGGVKQVITLVINFYDPASQGIYEEKFG